MSSVSALSDSAIRSLARRAGVTHISAYLYEEVRYSLGLYFDRATTQVISSSVSGFMRSIQRSLPVIVPFVSEEAVEDKKSESKEEAKSYVSTPVLASMGPVTLSTPATRTGTAAKVASLAPPDSSFIIKTSLFQKEVANRWPVSLSRSHVSYF